jgi:hypothetical protein
LNVGTHPLSTGNHTHEKLYRAPLAAATRCLMLNAWDQHFQAAHTTASRGHRLGIVGGSDTNHKVVGVGDFFGDAAADILYRDNATGDTWFADMSNGAFINWHQVGGFARRA